MSYELNPIPGEEKKLKFYFHTSLWCLKRFYEGLQGKAFYGKVFYENLLRHHKEA